MLNRIYDDWLSVHCLVLLNKLNESRASDNLGWASGTSTPMFWHISLNMIDFVFDNLTAPSLTIHKFGPTIQAIKLYKLLSHASSEFIISYVAWGHGFFGLDWILFDIEHALFFKCK